MVVWDFFHQQYGDDGKTKPKDHGNYNKPFIKIQVNQAVYIMEGHQVVV